MKMQSAGSICILGAVCRVPLLNWWQMGQDAHGFLTTCHVSSILGPKITGQNCKDVTWWITSTLQRNRQQMVMGKVHESTLYYFNKHN